MSLDGFMIDKETIRQIMTAYGKGYAEMTEVLHAWESGKKPDNDFFRLENLPGRIFIEPTNRCNKNCIYCARHSMVRNFSSLSLNDFKRAVSGVSSGNYITFAGNGEPLLNPQTTKMISYASQKGLLVGIICNGSRLVGKTAHALIEAQPNRVQISFDAVDKAVFNESYRFPKGGNSYESTLLKILNFILLERTTYRKGLFITIASVLTENVMAVREKSRAFWESLPVDNYYEGPLLSLQTNSGLMDKIARKKQAWKVCVNPWASVKINADGKVNPCIQDFSSQYIIGNIKERPLKEIINSKKAIDFRKAIFFKDIDFLKKIGYNCHNCNTWKSDVQHDIKGYLEEAYPITYGLMVKEASAGSFVEPKKMEALENAIADMKERVSRGKIRHE